MLAKFLIPFVLPQPQHFGGSILLLPSERRTGASKKKLPTATNGLVKLARSARSVSQNDMTSLRYRNTFIDVVEVEDVTKSPQLQRSSSCPSFDDSRNGAKLSDAEMMVQMAELEVRCQQLDQILQHLSTSKVVEEKVTKNQVEEPSGPPPGSPVSCGSLGHPELCHRPCINFMSGKCKLAEECTFCHLPHVKTLKFDKQQRQMLAKLPKSTFLATALPHLQQKVKDHGLSKAKEILEMLEEELIKLRGVDQTSGGPKSIQHQHQRISKVMEGMPFAALLGLISKHLGSLPMDLRGALEQLRV